jgi:hypothetical protein
MKNIIKIGVICILASLSISTTNQQPQNLDDYNRGWKIGFDEGWKDVKGQFSISPIPPLAPLPDIGLMTYNGGYNKGFKVGRAKALSN